MVEKSRCFGSASTRSSAQKYLHFSFSFFSRVRYVFVLVSSYTDPPCLSFLPTLSSTVSIPTQLNLDPRFIEACLASRKQDGILSPLSPTETPVSKATSLIENYAYAYSDFYGRGTPCVFKTGPDWPVRKGPQAHGKIVREPRPIYRHAIQPTWVSIGTHICDELESLGVQWTSINPLAYANPGDAKPFCPIIISVGVKPHSLVYEDAVAAAAVVKKILADAGFPEIEVAFVESVVTRSATPKLLSFNPLFDDVPALRKPFTPTLGLSIAPCKYPHYEGTTALYFRLSKDDNRVAILTCAHVARPPPVYPNTGMTYKQGAQRREEIVALGTIGYDNAIRAMMATIRDRLRSIDGWNGVLRRLGEPVEGENTRVTERRHEDLDLVAKATKEIQKVNAIHDEVTKLYTTLEQRVIGFVLHSEKIEVSVGSHQFTNDWALIELYREKIDWATFKGNKVYVGMSFSISLPPSLVFFISRRVFHLPSSCLQF
jgi:hypothetical protein